jgi:hypothetical protein
MLKEKRIELARRMHFKDVVLVFLRNLVRARVAEREAKRLAAEVEEQRRKAAAAKPSRRRSIAASAAPAVAAVAAVAAAAVTVGTTAGQSTLTGPSAAPMAPAVSRQPPVVQPVVSPISDAPARSTGPSASTSGVPSSFPAPASGAPSVPSGSAGVSGSRPAGPASIPWEPVVTKAASAIKAAPPLHSGTIPLHPEPIVFKSDSGATVPSSLKGSVMHTRELKQAKLTAQEEAQAVRVHLGFVVALSAPMLCCLYHRVVFGLSPHSPCRRLR